MRVTRAALLSIVVIVAVLAALAAGFMWRLSQGPVSLAFLTDTVQRAMNANLKDMQVRIDDVVVEQAGAGGRPRFRLRNVRLVDGNGQIIARAPRAAVGVSGRELLSGNISPRRLELIGPRLLIQRTRDGRLRLGFTRLRAEPPHAQASGKTDRAAGKSDKTSVEAGQPDTLATNLLDLVNRQITDEAAGDSALSGIEEVLISQASIALYDEVNGAVWSAPRSNLVFKRVPYGFALFMDARIATSGGAAWRSEIVATFKRHSRTFTVSARIFDLNPAQLARNVFALSKLAQVDLPLSGHAEVEFTNQGVMTRASAELTAGAGRVGFPDYIAEPVIVNEGLLRLDYDPQTGDIVIGNSTIFVAGRQAELQGRIQPRRDSDGRLRALRIILDGRNIAIDTDKEAATPVSLDRVKFEGEALLDEAKLKIDDLILMSGGSGMRLRGSFIGEDGGIGIYVAGRIRDLRSPTVKALWPPTVATGARGWIRKYVVNARIPTGAFRIAIPGKTLTAALKRDVPIPDKMVHFTFSVADVVTGYFEDMPPISGAFGEGMITGNHFLLKLKNGEVTLPGGQRLTMTSGVMKSHDLAARVTPATITIEAKGNARGFLELFDMKPLRLVRDAGFDASKLRGKTAMVLRFAIPLSKGLSADQIKVTASARLLQPKFQNLVEGIDIEGGSVNLNFSEDRLSAKGPVTINGMPVKLSWIRSWAKNGPGDDRVFIETTLSDKQRRALGIDLSDYITGKIPVQVKARTRDGKIKSAEIAADLARATLRLEAIGWMRQAQKGTKAKFNVQFSSDRRTTLIRNLVLRGKDGLRIRGELRLDENGRIVSASFPTIVLDANNRFAVVMKRSGAGYRLAATGERFDAQPLISSMFFGSSSSTGGLGAMTIDAAINRVIANRGETINGVRGRIQIAGGQVKQADLRGTYANSQPVALKITPAVAGLRNFRLIGSDAGATLRAANLYSKIFGGSIDFHALLGSGATTTVRRGRLVMRNFEVRDEAALASVAGKAGKNQRKTGPRRARGQRFAKLTLPFSVDQRFVRIGDALIKGAELGASAQGMIRKADGRMDIGGTIIPAYALNAAIGEVPLLGQLLVGGKGQGIFGLNFALQGTMKKPKFIVNPVSAIAPGFLRRIFDIGGGGVAADGTPAKPRERKLGNAER